MAELVLLHHAGGLTAGCLSYADELRAAGHVVHTPDLYDGRTFADLAEGVGNAEQVGFDTIMEAGAWGDVEVAHQLAETIASAGLFLYPGDRHLFTDNSLPDYDERAATLLKQRVLSFLDIIESPR